MQTSNTHSVCLGKTPTQGLAYIIISAPLLLHDFLILQHQTLPDTHNKLFVKVGVAIISCGSKEISQRVCINRERKDCDFAL